MATRRDFLKTAAIASAAAGLAKSALAGDSKAGAASGKKTLLVLGGTRFLGPAVVEEAEARGFEVVLFNRGKTNTHLFPHLEKLRGDRDPDKGEGLKALEGRHFDAIVDTSGHFPRHVRATAALFRESAAPYVFVSSLSVYDDHTKVGLTEEDPTAKMEDPTLETFGENFEHYGALKALCEEATIEGMAGTGTVVRPGLIVGPRDSLPRFTHWPVRIRKGGEVLAPGNMDDPVTYIDVRDLAAFIMHTIEQRHFGIYNTVGPTTPTNIAEMLYGIKAVTGGTAQFTWVPAEFLAEEKVTPWGDLPVWIPPNEQYVGFHQISTAKAIAAGLTCRPLAETTAATLEWYDAWPEDEPFPWPGGLDAEREKAVLAKWRAKQAGEDAPKGA